MGKGDNKSRALGDDPLAWLNAGADTAKKSDKKSGKKKLDEKKSDEKKLNPEKVNMEKAGTEKAGTEKASKEKPVAENQASPSVKSDNQKTAAKPETEQVNQSNKLVLESSLVINKANEFHQTLKNLAASGQAIEIDASRVEIIDSAILQLLYAFALDLKKNGATLSWQKPTEGLLNKASILGLTEKLGL